MLTRLHINFDKHDLEVVINGLNRGIHTTSAIMYMYID